jgi:hypothetical protein
MYVQSHTHSNVNFEMVLDGVGLELVYRGGGDLYRLVYTKA